MMKGTWILERCVNDRFPYRLQIQRGDKPWLILRTQDRWPAAGKRIFCLREEVTPDSNEVLEELERVNIIGDVVPLVTQPMIDYLQGKRHEKSI